jgi:uncharacterized protein (DUF1778 family)
MALPSRSAASRAAIEMAPPLSVTTMSGGGAMMRVKKGSFIMAVRQPRTEKIDLRVSPEAKRTIVSAARAAGQSISDFVLQSALARAEETLPDRRYFRLNAEQWAAFMAALDAPPRELPRLRRLLDEPSVFETSEPR